MRCVIYYSVYLLLRSLKVPLKLLLLRIDGGGGQDPALIDLTAAARGSHPALWILLQSVH
jgi:hypothetical protein